MFYFLVLLSDFLWNLKFVLSFFRLSLGFLLSAFLLLLLVFSIVVMAILALWLTSLLHLPLLLRHNLKLPLRKYFLLLILKLWLSNLLPGTVIWLLLLLILCFYLLLMWFSIFHLLQLFLVVLLFLCLNLIISLSIIIRNVNLIRSILNDLLIVRLLLMLNLLRTIINIKLLMRKLFPRNRRISMNMILQNLWILLLPYLKVSRIRLSLFKKYMTVLIKKQNTVSICHRLKWTRYAVSLTETENPNFNFWFEFSK